MYANAETGQLAYRLYAIFKRASIGEKGSAGDNSVAVRLRDTAIYACGPPQIVRIHDQIPQNASLFTYSLILEVVNPLSSLGFIRLS
jgi:hypothetical protein